LLILLKIRDQRGSKGVEPNYPAVIKHRTVDYKCFHDRKRHKILVEDGLNGFDHIYGFESIYGVFFIDRRLALIIVGGSAMFKKNQDDGQTTASPLRLGEQQPIRSKNVSVIGPTLVIKGELSADEDLVIEGYIEGTIAHHKKNLTIGKQGRVTADIHASSVIVEGELNGDIHGDGLVSLAKSSTVNGNVFCTRLVMEDGAKFNGNVEMVPPTPLEIAPIPKDFEDQ
jgi:cytoskeletal protein CcmA (bactofilin family)